MQTLSEAEVLAALASGELFEAELDDGSLLIRVRDHIPHLCTAVHAGHRLRKDISDQCLIDDLARQTEEDPLTDQLIDGFPVILATRDSRYEYDLNRSPEDCVYETAWNKQLWRSPLTAEQIEFSRNKHARYYRILEALLASVRKRFGGCLVVDVHSYNWQIRNHADAPVFNIGTEQIETKRWRPILSKLQQHLSAIELPNLETEAKFDTVFFGRGYQATFVREWFPDSLLVPLEIKKIFMDETNGDPFPLVFDQLQEGLSLSVLEAAESFNKKLKRSKLTRAVLLPADVEPIVLQVDKALYRLAKNIDTLHYVNPTNIQSEKKQCLARRDHVPAFRYRQLRIDPYEFREKLYQLPVSQIQDPSIRGLYRSVVDSYATKIELLVNVGTPQFLYNSLRYYGEPNPCDIANANFILHAKEWEDGQGAAKRMGAEEAKTLFEEAVQEQGLKCRVVLSTQLVARAMVDNSGLVLMVNRNASFTQQEVDALIHHELGIHMVTTLNAMTQPLQVFRLGHPGNAYTQEGLAILSEYRSGNLTLHRLRELALRVLAVDMMIKGKSFNTVFHFLKEEHGSSADDAFNLTVRAFRGGGFTKDFLYLRGFRDLVTLSANRDIEALFVGKTGLQSLDTLEALITRGILVPPQYTPPAMLSESRNDNPNLDYLVYSIK